MCAWKTNPDFDSLRPIYGERIDALEHAWITAERSDRHEIEIAVELLRRQAGSKRSVLLAPPENAQADGPIRLGQIVHGHAQLGWCGIHETELMQHMAVMGRSGSGKSTLCLRILLQLMQRGINWLVFDYKRSARALRALEVGRDVRVVSFGRDIGATMSFNLLVPPPGVDVDSHIRTTAEQLAQTWFAGDGVLSLLERSMRRAFEQCAPAYPTIADVRNVLEDLPTKSRETMWQVSTSRILRQLTSGQLGRILTRRRDARALERLCQEHTIIELDGLATNDANFLVQHVLRYLTSHLLTDQRREQLRCVCMVEEAHHLLAKHEGRESVLETCLREGREIGLGIMLADQTFSKIAHAASANCFTTVCLNMRHKADVSAAAGSLLLGDDQRDVLGTLPVGEAIVRLSDRWPYPVHVRCPPLDVPKGQVTDEDVRSAFLQGPFSALSLDREGASGESADTASNTDRPRNEQEISLRPRHEESASTTHSSDVAAQATTTDTPRPPPQYTAAHDEASDLLELEPDARLFLQSVARDRLLGVAERFDGLGLSRRKGNAIKNLLCEEGFLRAVDLSIPQGRTVLLDLTDHARTWLARHRVAVSAINGSLVHAWWQRRVCDALRGAGWTVETEKRFGTHVVDVFGQRGGQSIVCEVETGRSDWLSNVSYLASSAADIKAVVWLDSGSLFQIEAALPASVQLIRPHKLDSWVRWLTGQ